MARQILFLFFTSLLVMGCYSIRKSVEKAQPYSAQFKWPADFDPGDADFYIFNKIQIDAKPELVWQLLIHAEDWPSWYEGMREVKVIDSKTRTIEWGSCLQFSTMGQVFEGRIREFEPFARLAWETKNKNLKAYHAWLLIPNEDGCLLITDEVQKGKLAKLQKIFLPNKLKNLHDDWLTGFKTRSEKK